jgi:hypothetical protein
MDSNDQKPPRAMVLWHQGQKYGAPHGIHRIESSAATKRAAHAPEASATPKRSRGGFETRPYVGLRSGTRNRDIPKRCREPRNAVGDPGRRLRAGSSSAQDGPGPCVIRRPVYHALVGRANRQIPTADLRLAKRRSTVFPMRRCGIGTTGPAGGLGFVSGALAMPVSG